MFEIFRSKKALVRERLQAVPWVKRTWFEWCIENGETAPTLTVELAYATDPKAADFRSEDLVEIRKIVEETGAQEPIPGLRVRVIPRMYQV